MSNDFPREQFYKTASLGVDWAEFFFFPERRWVIEFLRAVGVECKVLLLSTLTLQSLIVGPVGACERTRSLGRLHCIVPQHEVVMFLKIIQN